MTQLYENILLAISGLRANKMRALLTMLGQVREAAYDTAL